MKRVTTAAHIRFGRRGCKTLVVDNDEKKVTPVIERPVSIQQSGDGPISLDFKPGEGTDIIDHQMEVAERFYKPGTPVPLDVILEHEAKRKHLNIYSSNPEREIQVWENGMPRFVRAPMHMIHDPLDSKNSELPPGPVLHDTRTGLAIRILGPMIPSPEMRIREDNLRQKMVLFGIRYFFWGFLFLTAFLLKFMSYMALRTKLRTQGIANPVLPANRIKTLEIIRFARENFPEYKKLFNEFKETQWIPYRQACLRSDSTISEKAAEEIADLQDGISIEQRKILDGPKWYNPLSWFNKTSDETSNVQNVYIPQLKKSFDIDLNRHILGLTPDGPVYAPPDVEVFKPDDFERKMKKLKSKIVSQMDDDVKQWATDSYDKRGRDHADEFIVKFHGFLKQKGVIIALDPDQVFNSFCNTDSPSHYLCRHGESENNKIIKQVEKMYDLQSVPRIQDLDHYENDGNAQDTGRPRVIRTI